MLKDFSDYDRYYVVIEQQKNYWKTFLSFDDTVRADLIIGVKDDQSKIIKWRQGPNQA